MRLHRKLINVNTRSKTYTLDIDIHRYLQSLIDNDELECLRMNFIYAVFETDRLCNVVLICDTNFAAILSSMLAEASLTSFNFFTPETSA